MVASGLRLRRASRLVMQDSAVHGFHPGHTVDGRYELLDEIARGGMGSVWRARLRGKHGFEKLVAIKTVRPGTQEVGRLGRMLLEEARLAARVVHPNVVQTLELGDNGTLYVVMEWIDGVSLGKLLER